MSFQTSAISPAGNNTKLNNDDGWHIPNKALWGVVGVVVLCLLCKIICRFRRRNSSKINEANHSDDESKEDSDDEATSKV
ncbi:hypothetical protein KY285_001775 [Solanum tuberosum]|nr:hypothetical protein KY289_004303 [Solanum tuberosum]KAH0765904.1 hypothetical protein KY285_001775 [Solanum tuberosum]